MTRTTFLSLSGACLLAASPALAQVVAMADTDLNLRSGPGSSYEIVGVIPSQGEVTVTGCMTDTPWCQVEFDGTTAWASGDYLSAMVDNTPTVIYANREVLGVGDAGFDVGATDTEAALGAGAAAAITVGALIGGPAAIAAALLLGGSGAAILNDEDSSVVYVRDNPLEPIYLDGEIVLGAGIPAEVALTPVPDSDYDYAYINGQPVLVERTNRQIVYVVR